MKSLLLFSLLSILIFHPSVAQEFKPDGRMQIQKEDAHNAYHSDEITNLDMLQALEFAGIQIKKFHLGQFDTVHQFFLFADEYRDGKLIHTDTLLASSNKYHYYERGVEEYSLDFIDQIKFVTKEDDNKSELKIITYAMSTKKSIELEKFDEQQFFVWRSYQDTQWCLNKKIPLMIFASSWKDKVYNFHRFCGRVILTENDEDTQELLSESPTYIQISYKVL